MSDTTQKFDEFIAALDELCKKHDVTLSVSGYDGLVVWNHTTRDGDMYVNSCGIEDCTRLEP